MIKLLSMDKIQALLKKSNLVLEEQNELLAALKLLPSTELNELYNFLKNHPEWVISCIRIINRKNPQLL